MISSAVSHIYISSNLASISRASQDRIYISSKAPRAHRHHSAPRGGDVGGDEGSRGSAGSLGLGEHGKTESATLLEGDTRRVLISPRGQPPG